MPVAQELLEANSNAAGPVREILQAGERAAQLTRYQLAYARKVPPHLELVNITKLVRETGVLIRSTIPKKVHIEYRLQEVPFIAADPGQVQQVMMNLIINAGQAMYE
jgi:two-component system, cell cycle sensor histidine kinase and response regulator CckA